MMIDINDIKNGMTVIVEGNLYQIVEFLHVKPGKGAAFMKTKLKNLRTGGTIEKTFNTNIKIEKANISKKTMQYLYNTTDMYYFMDMNDTEIADLLKLNRSTVYRHRTSGLAFIKEFMEENEE